MKGSEPFDARDVDDLRRRGIPVEEAARQLAILARPQRFAVLDRPCTVGDGIEVPDEAARAEATAAHERAAAAGRFVKFVPASGAATRMFRHLLPFRDAKGPLPPGAPKEVREFLENLDRFAFRDELARALGRKGMDLAGLDPAANPGPVLFALLDPEGLACADLPKGLLPFHAYPEGARTAFEEHLVEAAGYLRDGGGTCNLHFTVSPAHTSRFRNTLADASARLEKRSGARAEVRFSVQKPSTDTLALTGDGRPFRDARGRLLFRPGGHGALIENLADLRGDLVFIQNVDNVAHDRLKPERIRWKKILGGLLVLLQGRVREHLAALRDPSAGDRRIEEAARFARARLHRSVPPAGPGLKPRLIELLDRPLRVCGVVRNTGEPGGGPFWVREPGGGTSLQIVESAQVDPSSPEQRNVFARSTHFNPVNLACALRGPGGEPYDPARFVAPDAVFVSRKSYQGRDLLALERPGLWNGAMARWNTVFVEVPLVTFTPVKTVNDLLRPAHQPA